MLFKFLLGNISLGANRKIPFVYVLWFALALFAVLAELFHHSINNYLIFKNVFWHLIQQKNIFLYYPAEYEDHNLYGPIFSLIIAPFAILPTWAGVILWVMFSAAFLFYAVHQLPLSKKAITAVLLISAIDFMTSCHNVQSNAFIAGCIILSYTFIQKEKDFWSALFVAIGFLVKIYGVAGIVFFMFSTHKIKFAGSFIFWLIVLFCLPMLISSPGFILQTYHDWFVTLSEKNVHNLNIAQVNMQNLSVMGMISRTTHYAQLSNLWVLIPAASLISLPLVRFKLYNNVVFQLYYLCIALISVVIFSTGSESATYVIAIVGVAIWYVLNMHKNSTPNIIVLVSALLITSLSST
ncbi:MAG TPA: glycosyltransferase family 87 protein, partial [Segetibacter sp.]|nr:glycosyltransferase family 87 protein [Segetibacter sp.]